MPDKYEFRRYADNLSHPWFSDIKTDFKQLWLSPNRLLLCLLCIILMNIDESTFFEQEQDWEYDNDYNDNNSSQNDQFTSNGIILYHENALIASNNRSSYKQCNRMPIFEYLGSKKKNIFYTQLMIGVMFGFIMKCRIPVLFSFINIIIRSGCSFKPKIIPMFIDNKTLRPQTFYGSSYKLLNKSSNPFLCTDYNNYDSSSSDDDDDDDDDDEEDENEEEYEEYVDYDFIDKQLPKQLFGDF